MGAQMVGDKLRALNLSSHIFKPKKKRERERKKNHLRNEKSISFGLQSLIQKYN